MAGKGDDNMFQYQGELRGVDLTRRHESVQIFVPARIDFAGGWTDNGIYPKENPAAILNVSTDCLGIYIAISCAREFGIVYNGTNPDDNLLINAVLEFLELSGNKPHIQICIENSIPRCSGLGGSGLLIYGVMAGILSYYEVPLDKMRLMNYVIEVEKLMGSHGGWNDTSALIYSGTTLTQTRPDRPGQYHMQNIIDSDFENLCLLVDTGIRRDSVDFNIIRNQYARGDSETIMALAYIRKSAVIAYDLLANGKYLDFGKLIFDAWQKVCAIEPKMRIAELDIIEEVIGQYLAGGKLCGAGGGGFYLGILNNARKRDEAVQRLREKFKVYEPIFKSCLEIKKI